MNNEKKNFQQKVCFNVNEYEDNLHRCIRDLYGRL